MYIQAMVARNKYTPFLHWPRVVYTLLLGLGCLLIASQCESPTNDSPPGPAVSYPLDDHRIMQPFALFGASSPDRYHAGEDAFADAATPVFAMADGQISYSGYMYGYGWLIIIDHHDLGVYSLYGHVSTQRWKLLSGAISQGDTIASIADAHEATGYTTPAGWIDHLHFGVRVGQREDYPYGTMDARWMAGYTYAHPCSLGWLDPSAFIASGGIIDSSR
ncbi:MAG: M23 family metallopeptidase [Fidelibacterota bacterium]|nr:MAG: M23 family metallopeptidase [Candidatus Neomarinimicrobiota bacterium]